ncbi:hypothetical protein PM082_000290 [Marasmius tenuissimus]|nr:hypothetical protein PM082_000290 [Marasmius tenuissimus]
MRNSKVSKMNYMRGNGGQKVVSLGHCLKPELAPQFWFSRRNLNNESDLGLSLCPF